jgi:hypothetical protein
MRPTGAFGGLAVALRAAAIESPGTVADLAGRAQVGYAAARYTASRLVERGELVVRVPGRPAVLGAPPPRPPRQHDEGLTLEQVWAQFV